MWDVLELPLLHFVHRLICSCLAPKSFVIGESTEVLSAVGDVEALEDICSEAFKSSSDVS